MALDEDAGDGGGFFEAEVAAVRGEDDGVGVGVDGAGGGFEFPIEELVEAAVGGGGVGEVCRVEVVLLDEGCDAGGGGWGAHAAAVPGGEEGAFDEEVERECAEGISVGPFEEAFAVDLFGFEGAGVAIEVLDGFHAGVSSVGGVIRKPEGVRISLLPERMDWQCWLRLSQGVEVGDH